MPAWITSLLGSTDPARRNLKVATIVGLIGVLRNREVRLGGPLPASHSRPALGDESTPVHAGVVRNVS